MSSGNVIETSTHALVVFFSRAGENYCATGNQMIEVGHTLRVAQNVARLTQSPILELVPEHPYPAEYQATVDIAKREWEKNERPALARSVVEKLKAMLSGVRVLYLGFPIWCGTFPRHVATFLDAARDMGALEGTLILPFSTQEGSGFGNSLGELARLAPQAIIAPGFTCQGIKAAESENGVRAWLSGPVVNRSIALAMEGDFQNNRNDAESAAKETPSCGCALLAQRTSLKPKYLTTPAPSMQTLEHIAQAAMRVPDHNHLVPYRYVVIDENAREALGACFEDAARRQGADDEKAARARSKAKKGPMLIAFVARTPEEPEVSREEMLLTAGASLGQFMQALALEGFGGIVLSGSVLEDEALQKAFCSSPCEKVLAWITVGTPAQDAPTPEAETRRPPLSVWTGK